jgi:hypothetical protein
MSDFIAMKHALMSYKLWNELAVLLPDGAARPKASLPPCDVRAVFNGILFVLFTVVCSGRRRCRFARS